MAGAAMPLAEPLRDRTRQVLNVGGAAGQIAASVYVAAAGTDRFTQPLPGGDPPIIPAGYAFIVWTPIFAGSLAYAAYQALPAQSANVLFRRIGWATALTFWSAAAWLLVAQRPERVWGTVALLATMTASLAFALRRLHQHRADASTSAADRYLVYAPVSVYLGWCSIALFANAAVGLRYSGFTQPGAEVPATIAMIAVAGAGAIWTTIASGGNAWYAATVAWGLAGIVVANVVAATRPPHLVVAGVGAAVGVAVLAAALVGRALARRDRRH